MEDVPDSIRKSIIVGVSVENFSMIIPPVAFYQFGIDLHMVDMFIIVQKY